MNRMSAFCADPRARRFCVEAFERRLLLAADLFPGRFYPVGTTPKGITSADINMDGQADLITANYGSNNLTVMFGDANGTFPTSQTIPTGTQPTAVEAADLNGDGRPDLAVADYNQVTVVLFSASAGYSTYSYTVSGVPQSIAIADLNGDGKPDLIVPNSTGSTIAVLLNQGNGLFSTAVNYNVGSYPVSVVATDLNGDGFPDIAVCNNRSATVSVLLDSSSGVLSTAATYTVGVYPTSIIATDVNGDSKPDLIIAAGSYNPVIDVLPNTGGGTFGTAIVSSIAPTGAAIASGSFVTNRTSDLVVVYSSGVLVLTNDGTGRYRSGDEFSTYNNSAGVVTGDFNGDGQTDLAVSVSSTNSVAILQGLGAGEFAAPRVVFVGSDPSSIAEADFAGNGQMELAVAFSQSDKVGIVSTAGAFSDVSYATPVEPGNITVADVNFDQKPDLIVTGYNGGLFVMLNKGNGSFGAGVEYLNSVAVGFSAVGDFNGDGFPDIATMSDGTSGSLYVLLNNGDGTFRQESSPGGTSVYSPGNIVSADVDGDGKPDLLVAPSFTNTVYLFHNLGSGLFAAGISYTAGPSGATIYGLAVADFNHDGRPDLAAVDYTRNTVSVLLNNTNGGFNAPVSYPVGTFPTAVIAQDLNGDGLPDLAVADFHSNTVSVLINHGTGTFGSTSTYSVGAYPEALAAGDYNGDNLTDLVVANLDDGTLTVFPNRSLGGTPAATLTDGTLSVSEALAGGPVALVEQGGNDIVATQIGTYSFAASSVSAINVTATGATDAFSIQSALDAPVTYNDTGGTDVINLNAGPVSLAYSPASNSSSAILNVGGADTITPLAQFGADISRFGTVNILTNASLLITPQIGTAAVFAVNYLSISSGGSLILNHNALDVRSTSFSTIAKYLSTGLLVGPLASQINALALIANSQAGVPIFSNTHLFENIVPGATDTLLKYTYFGDANLDGQIDGSDYSRIDSGFLSHSTGWFNGDFNYDGVVNGSDYTLIDNAFNTQGASLAAQASAASSSSRVRFTAVVLDQTRRAGKQRYLKAQTVAQEIFSD